MTLRSKLLLFFFAISLLIVMMGMTFYIQLRNLIGPLTPLSIPRNVEQLANVIDQNQIADQLRYKELLVEQELDDYLLTSDELALQKYYMNSSLIYQLLDQAKPFDPQKWITLSTDYNILNDKRLQVIALAKGNDPNAPHLLVSDTSYQIAMHDYKTLLEHYFQQPNADSTETSVITVKLAAKNSYNILQKSLNTTLLIFFDAILASILLVSFSTRAIVQPINLLRKNMEQIDIEKMEMSVDESLLRLKGEVGDLARSFSDLFTKLRAATVLRDELLQVIQRYKKTEQDLAETAARLHESNLDLDQFAYAASHDLRSPLKAIQSLAQWIEEDCYDILPEESRKNFDLIKKRVHRLDALIAGMLEYSRAGRAAHKPEKIDLNKLMADIIDNLAPPSNIKITIDTVLPTIRTDKAKITQVFLNLINNAIKYNDKAEGFIQIGHLTVSEFYQFYVTDNGCGIGPAFHEKIFEIFQTLQSRDTIESSGIGLAIVKKIIEQNKGKIWLKSALHKGSTFYFTWPIALAAPTSSLNKNP